MVNLKKTLLICSSPENGGVGDIFLSDAISGMEKSSLVRYTLGAQGGEEIGLWREFKTYRRRMAISRWPTVSSIALLRFNLFQRQKVLKEIEKIIVSEGVEKIWVVLSSLPLISLAERVLENIKIPVHVMVWDAPEAMFQNHALDKFSKSYLLSGFAFSLQNASRIAVISEGMQLDYKSKYGVDSVVIRHGVRVNESIQKSIPREGAIKIIFAGSLYAKKEWNALCRALRRREFKILDRKIELYFLGRFPRIGAKKIDDVNYLGAVSYERVSGIFSEMDMGYVPYWFLPRKSHVVRTSFPGKVSAYAAAGLPIFFHGPSYSSVAEFLKKYQLGVGCFSLEEEEIVEGLERAVDGFHSKLHETWKNEAKKAVEEELGIDSMLRRLNFFLSQADTSEAE